MAKDPAFLFYPGDWLGGTVGLSRPERGGYIDLLMLQFNMKRMPLKAIQNCLGADFDSMWPVLAVKFKEVDGLFYNERLEIEADKRSKYTESRRKNRSQEEDMSNHMIHDMSNHVSEHMEDENEISIKKVSKKNTDTKIALKKELIKEYEGIEKTSKSISAFINSKKPDFSEPYKDLWNLFAPQKGCSKIEDVSKDRGKRLHTRLSEKKFDFVKILREAYDQDFEVDGKTFLNFDWLVKNGDNFIKVLEGNYRKRQQPKSQSTSETFSQPPNLVN